MNHYLILAIGIFLGVIVGFFVLGLCQIAHMADYAAHRHPSHLTLERLRYINSSISPGNWRKPVA